MKDILAWILAILAVIFMAANAWLLVLGLAAVLYFSVREDREMMDKIEEDI